MPHFRIDALMAPLAALCGTAILLAACQSVGERTMAQAAHNDICGAKPLRAFVGHKADQATRDAIERSIPNVRQLRWIVPGQDVLANLSTGRINVTLNDSGTISDVSCY